MTLAFAEAATHATTGGLDVNHVYCCDPDVGLCGEDISAIPDRWDHAVPVCVVCEDLDEAGAPCSPTCAAAEEVDW